MDNQTLVSYLVFAVVIVVLTGCSISFQNIDTHGTATDLVDETQSATPNVSPTLNLPVNPM